MYAFLWLGVIVILMTLLVVMTNQISGFSDYTNLVKSQQLKYNKDPLRVNMSSTPNDFTVDIVKSTQVSQPPFPPCVGYVDEVVYAPSDTNADIAQIKADLANLQKNIPNYVTDGVNQQAPLLMKGLLRQQGFPLQDDQYGQNLVCD